MESLSTARPLLLFLASLLVGAFAFAAEQPNIIFIMSDDQGYGDVSCLNPDGKINTPGADKLAREGMIFTDAHSGSSVCTPTRYGLLTGRYSWRTKLQSGVVTGWAPCLIAKDRTTVASMLRAKGYHTGIVGKWHLNYQYLDPNTGEKAKKVGKSPAVGSKIPDGPLTRGFDYFHGFHHARDMEAVTEGDTVIAHDDVINMLPRLHEKSVEYIDERAKSDQPFFLYVPLGSPHTPIVPTPEWTGKSKLNKYGDFTMQTDAVISGIDAALERNGLTDNTLIIFTTDNGCSKAAKISDLAAKGHAVSGPFRGSKADLWDGGHRVPFIVRWPGKIAAGSTSDELICHTDFFATAAEIVGSAASAEDSVSYLPAFSGQPVRSTRNGVIHHSISGHFAYRQGPYKLLLARASGGWSSPGENAAPADWPKAQLYDMAVDPGETLNLYNEKPELAAKLLKLLEEDVARGRSTDGAASENDIDHIVLWKTENKPAAKSAKNNKKAREAAKAKAAAKEKAALAPAAKMRVNANAAGGNRPNILFIIADDQSPFDLKMYNPRSTLDTPVLDQLAAEGMVFDGAYHMGSMSGAVCRPSRTMVMTGRTLWNLPKAQSKQRGGAKQKPKQAPAPRPVNPADTSMAAVFNQAGYDTMRTCKKGNSYPAANAKFTVVKDATKRGGTAETGSAWHAEQVLTYLKQRETANDVDPFLIYYGFSHPHDVRDGTPELLAKYGATNHKDRDNVPAANPAQPPLPINYLSEHPFHHGHPGLRDEVSVPGVWERRDERTIRNEIGREFACSENIDIQIGRVLDQLDAMGERDNTIIFYTADHGMAIGRHGLQGKQNLYEHTWRVPFIVNGPGINTGRAQGNIYLLDVLGTLCDLAGIDAPASVESKSFRPVLEGKSETVREVLYGAYCGGTKPGMRSVRKGDWKLIKYDVLEGSVRETQLFNLKANPHEYISQHAKFEAGNLLTDLAEDPALAEKLKEMEALLASEMKRLGDPYPLWDQKSE